MYIPPAFAISDDPEQIAAFVDRVGAAHVVTFDGSRPVATLIPVIWDRAAGAGGPGGRLLGHLALANPQWRAAQPDVPGLAIVPGPQAYISPMWYQSISAERGRTVPTWNYLAVHFTGPVTFHQDAGWLRDVVTRLTERHEAGHEPRYLVQDVPPAYFEGQLRGIVGFEMTVTQVEAKAKLSQNRSAADRAGVVAGLSELADPGSQEIASLMAAREAAQPS